MKKIRAKEEDNLPHENPEVLTSGTEQLECIDKETAAKHVETILSNTNSSFQVVFEHPALTDLK